MMSPHVHRVYTNESNVTTTMSTVYFGHLVSVAFTLHRRE